MLIILLFIINFNSSGPQIFIIYLTIVITLVTVFLVPKFQEPEYFLDFDILFDLILDIHTVVLKHVAKAYWILDFSQILFFLFKEFTTSGMSLLSDQSPPPITFPALALAKPHVVLEKKLS